MNQHVATVVPFRADQAIAAGDRPAIVKAMAEHLAAAVIADRLDLSNDIDVIDSLWRCGQQWQSRVILNHLDEALFECRQILVAAELTR